MFSDQICGSNLSWTAWPRLSVAQREFRDQTPWPP